MRLSNQETHTSNQEPRLEHISTRPAYHDMKSRMPFEQVALDDPESPGHAHNYLVMGKIFAPSPIEGELPVLIATVLEKDEYYDSDGNIYGIYCDGDDGEARFRPLERFPFQGGLETMQLDGTHTAAFAYDARKSILRVGLNANNQATSAGIMVQIAPLASSEQATSTTR